MLLRRVGRVPVASLRLRSSRWSAKGATSQVALQHRSPHHDVCCNAFSTTARENGSDEVSASPAYIEDEYNDAAHPAFTPHTYKLSEPFQLESGQVLENIQVEYSTYGQLNANKDNAIVLCHALTGHTMVHQWWDSMVDPIWTDDHCMICMNVLGSCYGTTGPASIDPKTNKPYGPTFPRITMRDAVRLQQKVLQDDLGIQKVKSVMGGSLGGMQTLEWAFLDDGDFVDTFVAIACGSHHSAWQIGMSELQRQAIYMDPGFHNGLYDPKSPPAHGLGLARQIAMMSYRTHAAYAEKFGRQEVEESDGSVSHELTPTSRFVVQSYLDYQGKKFLSRFDANSFLTLTHLMDTHDVGRGRGGIQAALASVRQPALIIGVDSDLLYPVTEQKELAAGMPNARLEVISSPHGHDGFLLGQKDISVWAKQFLDEC